MKVLSKKIKTHLSSFPHDSQKFTIVGVFIKRFISLLDKVLL